MPKEKQEPEPVVYWPTQTVGATCSGKFDKVYITKKDSMDVELVGRFCEVTHDTLKGHMKTEDVLCCPLTKFEEKHVCQACETLDDVIAFFRKNLEPFVQTEVKKHSS